MIAIDRIPRISVIIPSYNQAQYLEACIKSVIEQDYPDLEIILMDGGSTDGSAAIIQKYSSYFAYWQSGPDGGQTHAIVAGCERSTGELLTWLNSDDILLPGALKLHAKAYQRHPEADVFYGDHVEIDPFGKVVERFRHPRYFIRLAWLTMPYIAQPGTVFTRRIWDKVGGADINMQCAFDYDLWYRFMLAGASFVHVGGWVSGFRKHPESKGATWLERYAQEHALIRERYKRYWGSPLQRRLARLGLIVLQSVSGNYLYTIAFRLKNYGRLSQYRPEQ